MERIDTQKQNVSMKYDGCLPEAGVDFIGGTLGATTSVFIGQPLDTVKVKLQTFPHIYKDAFDCFTKTYNQEGITRGLYAGTIPSLIANISENAILFMAYGICQNAVAKLLNKQDIRSLNPVQNATAGCFAAFFSSLALCPTELVKCKLQAMAQLQLSGQITKRVQNSPFKLTVRIIREEGIRGLYRGFIPTIWREMPGYFFFFGGYETARYLFTPYGKSKDDIGVLATVTCGGIGGVSLWLAVYPFDVIKSRVQVHNSSIDVSANYGLFGTFMNIIRNEGAFALYKGLGPTLLRTFPATGGLFLTYETTKSILGNT